MMYPVSTRSLGPIGAAQPTARTAPYSSYPFREQRGQLFDYFPSAKLVGHLKRSAESAADWLTASGKANAAAKNILHPAESALQQRAVKSAKPAAISGEAAWGTKEQSFTVKVDTVARSQTNRGFELAKNGSSVIGAGTHTFKLSSGSNSKEISIAVGASDTNAQALGKLRDAINQSVAGLMAEVKEDKDAGTVRLEIASRETGTKQAFALTDKDGSAVSSTGIGNVKTAAADASYRLNGGGTVVSQSNNVSIGKGIRLDLHAAGDQAVDVKVGLDADAIVKQVKEAVGEVNKLSRTFAEHSAYLNPVLQLGLDQAMSSGAAERLGIAKSGGSWKLDEAKLRSVIENRPEIAKHDLSGSGGWTSNLARTLDRYESLPAEALLSPSAQRMTAYTSNPISGLQTYWQAPSNGWFLNAMF
jgi:flagellar hook-associated protein 2